MGWQEVKEKYGEHRTFTNQKAEDLVARRVLRGLGLVQRQASSVMRMLGAYSDDESLWDQTKFILKFTLRHSPGLRRYANKWDIEVVPPNLKEIQGRVDAFDWNELGPLPLFLGRDGDKARAFALWRADEFALLTPPYTVTSDHSGLFLTVQEAEPFFAQFGPYEQVALWRSALDG